MSNNGQSAKRASFSGKIGYVLAVAGSAVWLRNMEGESSFSFI